MDSEIDLKQIFSMVWSKKYIILLVVLVSAILGFVYTNYLLVPKYTASTSIILAQSQGDSTDSQKYTTQDATLNDKLISTYQEMAKSDMTINEVKQNLNITDMSSDAIKSEIAVTTVKSTQMLNISVTDVDPSRAKDIANEVAKVFKDQVPEYFNLNNAKIYEEATLPTSPSNVNHSKDILLFSLVGLIASIALIVIINLLDDSIKNSKDIEDATHLIVLAELPLMDFSK